MSVEVELTGSSSFVSPPVRYEFSSFAVGTLDQVDVMADVSCCAKGVRLRAVDVAGNEVRMSIMSWLLILVLVPYSGKRLYHSTLIVLKQHTVRRYD